MLLLAHDPSQWGQHDRSVFIKLSPQDVTLNSLLDDVGLEKAVLTVTADLTRSHADYRHAFMQADRLVFSIKFDLRTRHYLLEQFLVVSICQVVEPFEE